MDYLKLEDRKLQQVVESLELILAELNIHYHNLRHAHWNVRGPLFFSLHAAFEDDYRQVQEYIDEVAERVRALRYFPSGKVSDYINISGVEEIYANLNTEDSVKSLLTDKQQLISSFRNAIEAAQDADDEGTIDLIGGLLSATEKRAWMYDAWIGDQFPTSNGTVRNSELLKVGQR